MTKFFTEEESKLLLSLYKALMKSVSGSISDANILILKKTLRKAYSEGIIGRNVFGINSTIKDIQTALIVSEEMGLKGGCILSIMLHELVKTNVISISEVEKKYGSDVATIIKGLVKTNELYSKSPSIKTENFRNLLLSFAEDMRVILIMIADRLNIMRSMKKTANEDIKAKVSTEAIYLYAPLSHKLGLYAIKSELEDLSLKYLEPEMYYFIKDKLNETKASRDSYIAEFIKPVKQKLQESGLKFEIKGRTKSIHSIANKIKNQKKSFESIYDLFAIRIIIDTEESNIKEKKDCWQAYSIVTDMYQPNPKRLRDWLSIPKSNGYESLHITVMGFGGKWVEVQIRTKRMDDIAERGLAAHWRYKGIKGETGLDEWLTSVREALEQSDIDSLKVMDQFKMDLYDDEVFVFTPKGDLFKLPKGATVLDFAFYIHTKLGSKCIGAKLNGKNVQIKHKLKSGDQVEIATSNSQTPKQDWLNIATTSKARTKIRQMLKEIGTKQYEITKETIERRLKNRKLEYDDSIMTKVIKKMGYSLATEFYRQISEGLIDTNNVIDAYVDIYKKEQAPTDTPVYRSAEEYNIENNISDIVAKEDVLVIDNNLKGIEFKLSKCCNPIYGDDVFGFVTVSGGIKIHRVDCPNSSQMREKFGYRIIKARWAGKSQGSKYPITIRVVGQDDIGIVTNITSVISKELDMSLRSISINSNDGLFSGNLTVMIGDKAKLDLLIKKIKTIRGVKQVDRI